MAVSVSTSGSQTCTISTEHTLATVTDPGIYQAALDVSAAADGDVFVVRVYGKARSSDTERLLDLLTVGPVAPATLLVRTVAHVSPHYYRLTLTQTAGTGRAVPWAIYSTGA